MEKVIVEVAHLVVRLLISDENWLFKIVQNELYDVLMLDIVQELIEHLVDDHSA